MKTILMEKGRGDSGSETWNQVLLGNGRVKSSSRGPYATTPASYKFRSHPYPLHVACASSLSVLIPDLTFLLPTPEPASPQFLVLSLGLLEGLCVAIEGLRKGCHSSHYTTQLPGLNLAPESLQESVRVPANLLNPQVPS